MDNYLDDARLDELWRYANARSRTADPEPRTITVTDDEMRVLLLMLVVDAAQPDVLTVVDATKLARQVDNLPAGSLGPFGRPSAAMPKE